MIMKTIIGALVCCLAVVVGLFLYSDHQLQTKQAVAVEEDQATKAATKNTTVSANTGVSISPANTENTAAQPDKSLPIPAHQLKKLIADKPATTELDQKIQAANEAIAALDKKLEKGLEEGLEKERDAAPPQAEPSNTTAADQKIEEIEKRLKHIQDHLNKTQP
jgi:cytoskeletal protein RodZ